MTQFDDNGFPTDLTPIGTQPWETRPAEIPLDREEVRTALWQSRGNISEAADILKVHSLRLRAFVKGSEYLKREMDEAAERIVDMAESVVYDALRDPDRADSMARFVLNSTRAKERQWGNKVNNVNLNAKGDIVIQWANGETVSGAPMKDITPQVEVGVDENG